MFSLFLKASKTNKKSDTQFKKIYWVSLIVSLIITTSCSRKTPPPFYSDANPVHGIILITANGMGFKHLESTSLYTGEKRLFEKFPFKGEVTTVAHPNQAPDAAAAATAIATGRKVGNGVLSLALPGDGNPAQTILEVFAKRGKSTGIVTNLSPLNPEVAAFASHIADSGNKKEIFNQYLTSTKPSIVMGFDEFNVSLKRARETGYRTATTYKELLKISRKKPYPLFFMTDQIAPNYRWETSKKINEVIWYPHLSNMTKSALDILDADPDGFFLLVNNQMIDLAAHDNHLPRTIYEIIEFDKTIKTVLEWVEKRNDILIIVTSGHETGGLNIIEKRTKGNMPVVRWSTTQHTSRPVPIFATGSFASKFSGKIDNTEIFQKLLSLK